MNKKYDFQGRRVYICKDKRKHMSGENWIHNGVSREFFDRRIVFCCRCVEENKEINKTSERGYLHNRLYGLMNCVKGYERIYD